MTAIVVKLENVHRHYDNGRIKAVWGVDLTVRQGEWLTIIGPSGSGKSTLLHLMSGLDKPDKGHVFFDGRPIMSNREWTKIRSRMIGFIFQSTHLLPTLTALENVQLPMFGERTSARERRQKACHLLERVGLGHRTNHRPGDLSGGERQRVALARALANEPKLILADEPTGNLDSVSGALMIDLLFSLRTEMDTTIVLVTHSLELAKRGDRRIELFDGGIRCEVALDGRA